jgi:small nuclear ribonucleoprotein (snRNP)-like protein
MDKKLSGASPHWEALGRHGVTPPYAACVPAQPLTRRPTRPPARINARLTRTVKLNGNRNLTGLLRGYDQFMNIVLDETVEHVSSTENNEIGMVVRAARPLHTTRHEAMRARERCLADRARRCHPHVRDASRSRWFAATVS